MPTQEFLLGYDAREMYLDPVATWDQARREQYLLRLDVPKPLSVDCAVWPHFFDPLRSGEPRDWRIGCRELWDDCEILKLFVESDEGVASKPYAMIGITLAIAAYEDAARWCGWHGKLMSHLSSRMIPKDTPAVRLGFDVADGAMISTLSNSGYVGDGENVWEIREKWWSALNEHHLFERLEDAGRYRDFCDKRQETNSPFFVYGLYQIDTESGAHDTGQETDH